LGKANDDDHGVIGLLLDAGADVDAENNYGVSPRSLAELVSNFDLKRFLRTKE
jgi:ankyrin repeat protein